MSRADDELNTAVRTLRLEGWSYQKIAGALNLSKGVVAGKILRMGLCQRRQKSAAIRADVERLRGEGKGFQQIATELGVSYSRVYKAWRRVRLAAISARARHRTPRAQVGDVRRRRPGLGTASVVTH
jgi:hypothetical protein